ncbi:hypothetical protein FWK35_00008466 [Aphis craccivora]|uniref:Uncharacterized protein n=1 Tax=Aphis craccivora TaxID=307492 RepID=A0A6G0YMJ4_APHCR|nr:hypothetical protein FWK35_00008466 [Aphis craccivora]
MLVLSISN